MGDSATAMRDPIFYNWHTFANDLFLKHKDKLPPCTEDELNGIHTNKMDLINKDEKFVDELIGFWQKKKTVTNLENGLDFAALGILYARFTHLNMRYFRISFTILEDFYLCLLPCRITVNNSITEALKGIESR